MFRLLDFVEFEHADIKGARGFLAACGNRELNVIERKLRAFT